MGNFISKNKTIDLVVALGIVAIAMIVTVIFNLNPVLSWMLYYVPATGFLFLREQKNFLKIFLSALLAGVFVGVPVEMLANHNNIWTLDITIFTTRLFDLVAIDNFVWWFFSMFFVFTYYEHFVRRGGSDVGWKPKKSVWWFGVVMIFVSMLVYFIIHNVPNLARIENFYVVIGVVLTSPFLLLLIRYTKTLARFFVWSIPFFFINLAIEIIGLKLHHWSFNADYDRNCEFSRSSFPY